MGASARDAGSSTPSGIAIFGLRQDGVLIAEAGVPGNRTGPGGADICRK